MKLPLTRGQGILIFCALLGAGLVAITLKVWHTTGLTLPQGMTVQGTSHDQTISLPSKTSSAQHEAQREHTVALPWSRDPFSKNIPTEPVSQLTLSGILWDAHEPMAIINGLTVTPGDEVQGFRVLRIEEDRVTLTDDDGAHVYDLRLNH